MNGKSDVQKVNLQTLPFRVSMEILEYIQFVALRSSRVEEISRFYYGFFALDRFRKIFLICRNIRVVEESVHSNFFRLLPTKLSRISVNTLTYDGSVSIYDLPPFLTKFELGSGNISLVNFLPKTLRSFSLLVTPAGMEIKKILQILPSSLYFLQIEVESLVEDFPKLYEKFPVLRNLKIVNCSEPTREAIKNFPTTLVRLHFSGAFHHQIFPSEVDFSHLYNLKGLTFGYYNLQRNRKVLTNLPAKLKSLVLLRGVNVFWGDCLRHILGSLRYLEFLRLVRNPELTDDDFQFFPQEIESPIRYLEILRFEREDLLGSFVQYLPHTLETFSYQEFMRNGFLPSLSLPGPGLPRNLKEVRIAAKVQNLRDFCHCLGSECSQLIRLKMDFDSELGYDETDFQPLSQSQTLSIVSFYRFPSDNVFRYLPRSVRSIKVLRANRLSNLFTSLLPEFISKLKIVECVGLDDRCLKCLSALYRRLRAVKIVGFRSPGFTGVCDVRKMKITENGLRLLRKQRKRLIVKIEKHG